MFGTAVNDGTAAAGSDSIPVDIAGAPVPAEATPYAAANVSDTTTTQSFEVRGQAPEAVITAYVKLAADAGWTIQSGPQPSGSTDFTLAMVKAASSLLVTTTPADLAGNTELSIEITKS